MRRKILESTQRNALFTEKELKVVKMKLDGLMNREIARQLRVSEEDVSQTLSRVRNKIRKVEDSILLFESLNLINGGIEFRLSDKGKRLLASARTARRRIMTIITFDKQLKETENILSESDYPNPFQPSSTIAPMVRRTEFSQRIHSRYDKLYGDLYETLD